MSSDSFFSPTSSSSDDNEIEHTEGIDTIRNKHPKDLFLAYLNINSFRHKVINVRDSLKVMPVDILAISETKLDDSFPNAQFHINGYRVFRKDRNQYGGGVLVYVRSDIPGRQMREQEMTHTESIAIELNVNNSKYLIVST